jgi:hypothetical protein
MGLPRERYEELENLDLRGILEAISGASLGSTAGQEELNFLNQLLSTRVAEMLTQQLQETARVTGASASEIKVGLEHSTLIAKTVLENSSNGLINALKVSNETTSKNAREIKDQIADLSSKLARASTDLQAASTQSGHLSRRLNWLTAALVFTAIVTAAATTFQACQTKRQTDIIEEQTHQQTSPPRPQAAPAPATPPSQPKR